MGEADLIGVSAAISACAGGAKWAHAVALLQAVRANEVTFSAAITACGRSARWLLASLASISRGI